MRPATRHGRPAPTHGSSAGLAYIDGRIVDLADATVPLNDRGFLLGDGVFETLRTSNGKVFRLAAHEERIRKGLAAIQLDPELATEFRAAVEALVEAGTKQFGLELYVRIMVTTGPMEDVLDTGRGLLVTGICKKFKPYPLQYHANGLHVIISRQRKQTGTSLSAVKTLSFLPYITARREAHRETVHDAILLNDQGRVAEASTSNVFALVDGTLRAPGEEEGAIPGVTRAAVLEFAQEAGIPIATTLTVEQLQAATEVFLTNTTGGIVPVTRLAGKPVGTGTRGELTAQLSHALEAAIRGNS